MPGRAPDTEPFSAGQDLGGLRETWLQAMAELGAPVAGLQATTARMLALLLEAAPPDRPEQVPLDRRLRAVAADLRQSAAFLRSLAGEPGGVPAAAEAEAVERAADALAELIERLAAEREGTGRG
ncbi:MAG TPA: hypothetical protein VHQ65_14290 [Thermoanaerobaculia bacterium]|nr:hypothetical protein [Thermoanaerobaculia bacterium]